MIWKHDANRQGRDFFVGDLHGQLALLQAALARVGFDRDRDRLFCVGDLIDRGPDSLACLSLAFEPWFHGVRGNHEMLAYQVLVEGGRDWRLWLMNGGEWIECYDRDDVRHRLIQALERLPYAREVEVNGYRIGMVHAEPPAAWSMIETQGTRHRHDMLWGRTRIQCHDETPVSGIDLVIVGHTIVLYPVRLGNVLYIDTGAFHTRQLTLMDAGEALAWKDSTPRG